MNRRDSLKGLAALAVAHALPQVHAAMLQPKIVNITIDPHRASSRISPQFMGLGYEISSVAVPGLLHPANRAYIQMVRTLSPNGVIRIGGNTSDYAVWSSHGKAVASPMSTVVNEKSLQNLAGFLRATGWRLIWGLNLGERREDEVVREARAVASIVGSHLEAFEIGNEPDLFAPAHRAAGYNYGAWFAEYKRLASRVAQVVPGASFAGPDVAGHTEWVAEFAKHAAPDVKLLTHHYYAEGPPQSPASTIHNLLYPDPKLAKMLSRMHAISRASRIPFRICETNSCFGGGKPGVSDTFASALWGMDYLFTLAEADAEGVNMETGVNQLGFVSSYSPIVANENDGYVARPLYYGMLAFAQASQGNVLPLDYEAGGANFTAHASVGQHRTLWLALINKEASRKVEVRAVLSQEFRNARTLALTAPSLDSKSDVTLGAAQVTNQGVWSSDKWEPTLVRHGVLELTVPSASALLVSFGHG